MKKILLIEDNVDLAENVVLLLKEHDYDVSSAYNGMDGLKQMVEFKPDLILCDIMLPDYSGYKLLAELKKLEDFAIPLFIFLTAKTQREDLRKGMILGADDYITKPFTSEELIGAISSQFRKRQQFLNRVTTKDEESGTTAINGLLSGKTKKNKKHLNYADHIFINDKRNPGFYPVKNIVLIRTLRDYTQLYIFDEKKFFFRKSMIYWEEKLPKNKFVRIHKQTMINVDYVGKFEPISSHRFHVTMKGYHEKLVVSQRYSHKLKKML